MRIFILTMDDPVKTNPFLEEVILARKEDIIGLAVPRKGSRLTVGKNRSKLTYLFSLLFIMGLKYFFQNAFKTLWFKIKKKVSSFNSSVSSPSILNFAKELNIPAFEADDVNSDSFINELRRLKPDVIINQSQAILREELLSVPVTGTLNRHNALLPKNRGRLTPFWVLYKKEKETGVSIHFVNEDLDAGDIIIQKKFEIQKDDDFADVVEKNYEIAPKAMLEALTKIEKGDNIYIENDDKQASYNTLPTFKQSFSYRIKQYL